MIMVFSNIDNFFGTLNANCEYVILRNWDGIINNLNKGEDIDVLVRDKKTLIDIIDAIPKYKDKHKANYYFVVQNHKYRIDIRYVGDGYYPISWERSFIENRIYNKDINAYVLNETDHYYALLYHSIIQKPELTNKYLNRLCKLTGKEMTQDQFVEDLRDKLKNSNAFISLPEDCGVYVNTEIIKNNNLPHQFYMFDVIKRNIRKFVFKIHK